MKPTKAKEYEDENGAIPFYLGIAKNTVCPGPLSMKKGWKKWPDIQEMNHCFYLILEKHELASFTKWSIGSVIICSFSFKIILSCHWRDEKVFLMFFYFFRHISGGCTFAGQEGFECAAAGDCILLDWVCDGEVQCQHPDRSDEERGCQMFPETG